MTKKKASKRKGVGIDFKKVKHKVGRKLAPPQNVTNVAFKSKAIVLPGQSLALERDGLAVNHRNKTLKELFGQTTHYSERVRKDAFLGIKDLFIRHPKELEVNVISAIQKVSSRFTDVDKGVRHALLDLLQSIQPNIAKGVMQPLIPMVMAHVGSAMTHISNDIRMSAFSFMDLLMQHYPSLLLSFSEEILQYYQHFLGQGGVNPNAMATVLKCLGRFLAALGAPPPAQVSSVFSHAWSKKFDMNRDLEALYAFKSKVPEPFHSGKLPTDLFKSDGVPAVIHVLLNCWAECVPAVCSSPLPDAIALDCMVSISSCLSMIFEWLECSCGVSSFFILRAEFRDRYLSSFLTCFMAPFPVSALSLQSSAKLEEGLCALNVGICKVMLHFFTPNVKYESTMATTLLQYYVDGFSSQLLQGVQLQEQVIAPHMCTLLSNLPCLIECVDVDWKYKLLEAVTEVFETWRSQSVKLACVSTMSKVLISDSHFQTEDPSIKSMLEHFSRKWLQAFPKFLWELKHNHPSSSKAVLDMMLLLGKCAMAGSALAEEFGKLQPAMLPFFCTFLPKQERCLFGPFIKLPKQCQEVAVNILYYFSNFQVPFLKALATCCLCTSVEAEIVTRLVEVLQEAYLQEHIVASAYLSFIFTLLTGSPRQEQVSADEFENKHQFTVGALCHSLRRIGDGDVVLELLSKPMSDYLAKKASPQMLCRFLRVIVDVSQAHGKDGTLTIPSAFEGTISHQVAQLMVSQLMVEDGCPPVTILKYTILLIYRSKSFGRSFVKSLLVILDANNAVVVARILIELLKLDGITHNLLQSDVSAVSSALKEIKPTQLSSENNLKHSVSQVDLRINVAFGR